MEDHSRALLIEGPAGTSASLIAVGEALRAGGSLWRVQRLSWVASEEHRLDERSVRRALDVIAGDHSGRVLVVLAGSVVRERGVLRFVLARDSTSAAEGTPLAEIGVMLRARTGPCIVVAAVAAPTETDAAELTAALVTPDAAVIAAIADNPQLVIDTLVAALRGAARDGRYGAITAASLAAHLAAAHGAAVRLPPGDHRDQPWFEPPSLELLWRLGWSAGPTMPLPFEPATAAPAMDDPLVGAILPGQFQIEAPIASGSFGRVYRARQLTVGRDVAVKVIRAGVDPFSEDGRLFVHEIQAVARIDHRNVVRVYQADVTADGRLFFAMELLAGRDLQAIADAGALASARAVALVQQLLAALEAAHQAGLVHADVKPGNAIVVDGDGGDRLVLVDFGLSRLRRPDADTISIGGTPAFMAPEQLRAGRIDARSDQFSAALVLVALLTGWRRRRARDLVPPADVLDAIADPAIRAAVTRALAPTPDDRFPSVATFAAALTGTTAPAPAPPRPPFHGLAPFTEDDRGQLHGRDRELAQLTELVFYRRCIVVTAPSGVGKTSLLRAGLVPRLGMLGAEARYASCRSDDEARLAHAIAPGAVTLADALGGRDTARSIVVILDQVEAALEAGGTPASALLEAAVACTVGRGAGVHVVLSVREDFLARLLDRLPERGDGGPIVRVGPLELDGARDAIVRPLAERRLTIESELLECLLDDLTAAGARLGTELGWAVARPIYPSHLQLACAVLHDRLPAGAAALTLAHYRALGGFDAIVGEHLERVLDELDAGDAALARELFLALVTSTQLRSARTEPELAELIAPAQRARLPAVLEELRRQGLIVRTRRPGGELVWELIHDSLVPRALVWVDRQDLSRRRAIELVRHHVRRSRPEAPSLLSRAELRELADHAGAITALDAEWQRTRQDPGADMRWSPQALVARSRLVQRRSRIAALALGTTVVAGLGAALFERQHAEAELRAEAERRDRDLGLVSFALAPFDWDAARGRAVPVPIDELAGLAWNLHAPSLDDPDQIGDALPPERLQRLATQVAGGGAARVDLIEAPGRAAFLVVTGRGRTSETCAASIIPLRALPGYARRGAGPQTIQIRVPTCRASRAGMIQIPAGPFVFSGPGEPPSPYQRELAERKVERTAEQTIDVPTYWIDRTEVTNAAFAVFSSMGAATGIGHPKYPPSHELMDAGDAQHPVAGLTWHEAAAYCAFLGKRLPSSEQWQKALRGGLQLDGRDNPQPRRNFPWGTTQSPRQANLNDETPRGPRAVGSFTADLSPYGVVDLAGNVAEWIRSDLADAGSRMTRGGNWSETPADDLVNFMPIENARAGDTRTFTIGMRCADEP